MSQSQKSQIPTTEIVCTIINNVLKFGQGRLFSQILRIFAELKTIEMSKNNPLAEVFGFPISTESETAKYYRENRLCPYHNRFPNCTKDKANDPLGVCSVNHGDNKVITCPSRFREDWKILHDAASFVWPKGT